MNSLYIAQHLRIDHSEIIDTINYITRFVDYPAANTHIEIKGPDSLYYDNISPSIVLAVCMKLNVIEMFDPLILNFELQLA